MLFLPTFQNNYDYGIPSLKGGVLDLYCIFVHIRALNGVTPQLLVGKGKDNITSKCGKQGRTKR